MHKPDYLTTLYIDFDAFFAHVEKQLSPKLHDKSVGVIPLPSAHSGLIACCYRAKSFGVKRGMRQPEAKALCPDIVFLPARHDVYVRIHHDIIQLVDRFMPVVRTWSIDELECRLPRLTQQAALRLTQDMRAALERHIGALITPSIGLSSNQLLAKIAAEMDKPRGLIILHPDELPGKLFDVPLRAIPGIARGIEYRLNRAGIFTVKDLWNIQPKHARAIWRNVEGERLWAQLHGYVTARPETKRAMFAHGRILSGPWRRKDKARDCLTLLCAKAARRMRAENFVATKLTVSLKHPSKRRYSHEIQFPPSRDDFTLLRAMRRAFARTAAAAQSQTYLSASVTLHGLRREGHYSQDLFEYNSAPDNKAGYENLSDIMDTLNKRYGGTKIYLGPRYEPPGGYAGAKIAFGRVPSLEDFQTLTPQRKQILRK